MVYRTRGLYAEHGPGLPEGKAEFSAAYLAGVPGYAGRRVRESPRRPDHRPEPPGPLGRQLDNTPCRSIQKCLYIHLPRVEDEYALPFTHAYVPRDEFDEVTECDNWICLRKEDGYCGLHSQSGYAWSTMKYTARCELACEERENIQVHFIVLAHLIKKSKSVGKIEVKKRLIFLLDRLGHM